MWRYKTLSVYPRSHAEEQLALCFCIMCRRQTQGFKKLVLTSSRHVLFALHFFLILFVFLCSGERLDCDMRRDMSKYIAYLSRLYSLTEQWWSDI
jgi:hypothetical protein